MDLFLNNYAKQRKVFCPAVRKWTKANNKNKNVFRRTFALGRFVKNCV